MATEMTESFSGDDPEMEAAIRQAKENFGQFVDAYLKPSPCQKTFLVKIAVVENNKVEHIWIADVELRPGTLRGVVASEASLQTAKFMETVEFEPAQITDWMYVDDGLLVGGYTTRLIRSRMSPDERQALDADTPYRIT